jgi:hypothetical protein
MLSQNNVDQLSQTLGVVAKEYADTMRDLIASFSNIREYDFSLKQFADLPDEPDKSAGFTYINGNTWLPKRLVESRQKKRRETARQPKTSIVWTRR